MYRIPARFYFPLSTLHLVILSSRNYRTDGITHVFVSLNCNGSEDHLKNCQNRGFIEDVNCFTIATAICKGMWKDKQYMLGIEQGLLYKGMPSVVYPYTRYQPLFAIQV